MSQHSLVLCAVRDLIEKYSDQAIGCVEVAEHMGTTGVGAVAQALRELQCAGYIVLRSEFGDNGEVVDHLTTLALISLL